MPLVTRLLYRHPTNLSHPGIDRVSLEYARKVVQAKGWIVLRG